MSNDQKEVEKHVDANGKISVTEEQGVADKLLTFLRPPTGSIVKFRTCPRDDDAVGTVVDLIDGGTLNTRVYRFEGDKFLYYIDLTFIVNAYCL